MQLSFKQLAQRPDPRLLDRVRTRLTKLEELIAIDAAHITLLRNPRRPPFRATAHLEVPGPDLRADELAYTPMAALDRMFSTLTARARQRKLKRPARSPGRSLRANRPRRTATCR